MKKSILFLALGLTTLASCKKENTGTPYKVPLISFNAIGKDSVRVTVPAGTDSVQVFLPNTGNEYSHQIGTVRGIIGNTFTLHVTGKTQFFARPSGAWYVYTPQN